MNKFAGALFGGSAGFIVPLLMISWIDAPYSILFGYVLLLISPVSALVGACIGGLAGAVCDLRQVVRESGRDTQIVGRPDSDGYVEVRPKPRVTMRSFRLA